MRYFTPLNTRVALSDYNIFFNDAGMYWWVSFSSSYSSLNSWQSVSGFDIHSIQSNPSYVGSTGSSNPFDYRLQQDSPAIGAGRNGENLGAYPSVSSLGIGYHPVRPAAPILY